MRRATGLALLLALLAHLAALACALPAHAVPEKIILADDRDYPPFVFLDAGNVPSGILVDIWKLWSSRTGIPVEFRLMEWDDAISAVREGRAHVLGGVLKTPGREAAFELTKGFTEISTGVFFHRQLGGITGVADLAGFAIGVVQGDSVEAVIHAAHPGMTFVRYPGARDLVAAAVAGEVKVFVSDTPVALYYLAQHPEGAEFRQASKPVAVATLHSAVRKGDHELLSVVQAGFDRISDSEVQGILKNWSGRPLFSSMPWGYLGAALAAVFGALFAVSFWNLILRRRVKAETSALEDALRDLRDREEKFRLLVEHQNDLVVKVDAAGRFLYVSPAYCRTFGRTEEELLGSTFMPLVHEDDLPATREAMQNLHVPPHMAYMEQRAMTAVGWRWFAWNDSAIPGPDGDIVEIIGVGRDITERREAEEALRRSERLYRSVIDNIEDVFYRTDASGRLSMISPSGVRLLGYGNAGEMLGRPNEEFWLEPAQREDFLELIRTRGRVSDFEVVLRRKDGAPVLVATSSRLYHDEDGSVLGVEGIFRDISERKRSEELLRQSEEKFSQLFKLSPDAISLSEPDTGILVDVNEAFLQLSGYGFEELIGRSTLDLELFVSPDSRSMLIESLRSSGYAKNVELEYRRKDGSQALCNVSCLYVTIGQKRFLLSVARDMTEFKRMQEMMIQTEKMISVGGIAAGVAHEINNPLAIIVQTAQNMALRIRPDFGKNVEVAEGLGLDMEGVARYMEARGMFSMVRDIQAAALRASSIIRHMLDFSRPDESRHAACGIDAIVDKALALARNDFDLKKTYDFKKIHTAKHCAEALPEVPCSETEIEQVLLNLLRNAAQAMAMASPPIEEPRIDIRLSRGPAGVIVEVEDNGPGISPEVQRRVFEPFFTTKPPGIGTGLGLSVSYFIVTRGHGGRMWVESEPGRGTVFGIELPVSAGKERETDAS